MSQRYKGGVISATPPTTSTSSASGVWTEQQFMQGVASGSWPALAGAPTIGTATAGALSASVTFTAPTYTGSGITGYTVTSNPGGITGTGASSPVTVSGLTAGTAYTFTVTATTAAGQGPASAASNSVTPTAPNYIEDVYSTYLYTGNGSTQTITNSIDLSTKGGLVWGKNRDAGWSHYLADTAQGTGKFLQSNTTSATQLDSTSLTAFNANGFSIGNAGAFINNNGVNYASWTFRKQPKFFDVVTYTGNGSGTGVSISHALGSVPGVVMVKCTSTTGDWRVLETSTQSTLNLNATTASPAFSKVNKFGDYSSYIAPTSTTVYVNDDINTSGQTYVMYLFASNAGGFGLTGSDNVISCGSYVGSGAAGKSVTLGYEPQWVLFKQTSDISPNANQSWWMYDNMRGMPVGSNDAALTANTSGAEQSYEAIEPTATGFNLMNGNYDTNASGVTYIYIAIRRGPMKVPTSGTSVFVPVVATNSVLMSVGFPTDLAFILHKDDQTGYRSAKNLVSRLQGQEYLQTDGTEAATATSATLLFDKQNSFQQDQFGGPLVNYMMGRAPSFFDEVCYTGDGTSSRNITHNLQAIPELLIIKSRSNGTRNWYVLHSYDASGLSVQFLNLTNASVVVTYGGNSVSVAAPTSTMFNVGSSFGVNNSAETYVAYLFATCAGVSKVGFYTGTGTTQTINCGFSAGARWVLIKRTNSTGDWYVWDTARGMVSGTDPSLLLNSTAAEVNANSVYTTAVGFQIVSTASGINASGGTYIFLAIA